MPTLGKRLRDIIGDSFGANIVEQNLEKALVAARESAAEPMTTFYDPLSMFMGYEWVQRKGLGLSFTDMRAMARNPIVQSIIATRLAQVASFCVPQISPYDPGFVIKSDDPTAQKDTARMAEIKNWIFQSGITGYGESMLETLAKKFIRDSLELDQACMEVVYRRNGYPAYLVAVDGATIRRTKASLNYATPSNGEPFYVQVIDDRIVTEYTQDQLIFGVRNPQTNIYNAGYGMSELETLIRVVTAIVNAEKYNSGQLTAGGTSKGILVVKGNVADSKHLEIFKRDFREAIRNAASYWKPPVIQVGKDTEVNWVTLDRHNRDMEYAQLFDFLVKQACGVYQIDPQEINWVIGSSGASTTFESNSEGKQHMSKRKGLKPLLTFFANCLNTGVIQKFDPRYRIEFVGFEADREADSKIREREVKSYKTINQVRAEIGDPPIPGGNIVLNKDYVTALEGGYGGGGVSDMNVQVAEGRAEIDDTSLYSNASGFGS